MLKLNQLQHEGLQEVIIKLYMDEHGVDEGTVETLDWILAHNDRDLYEFLGRWMNGTDGRDYLDYAGHELEFAEDLHRSLGLDVKRFGLELIEGMHEWSEA